MEVHTHSSPHVHNDDGTVSILPKWGGRCIITSVDHDAITGKFEGYSDIFPNFIEFTAEENGTAMLLHMDYVFSIIPLEDLKDGTGGNTGTD